MVLSRDVENGGVACDGVGTRYEESKKQKRFHFGVYSVNLDGDGEYRCSSIILFEFVL